MAVDRLSVAHVGETRDAPPGPGVELTRDSLLRAHLGWLSIVVAAVGGGSGETRLAQGGVMASLLAEGGAMVSLLAEGGKKTGKV